jgi:hypothetical protein
VATTSTTTAVTATSAKAPHALEAGRNGEQHKQKRAEQPRLAFHGRLLFLATRAGVVAQMCALYPSPIALLRSLRFPGAAVARPPYMNGGKGGKEAAGKRRPLLFRN